MWPGLTVRLQVVSKSHAAWMHAQAKAVAAGANFTIALSLDGKISCFGASGHGQCDLPEQLQALVLQDQDRLCIMPCLACREGVAVRPVLQGFDNWQTGALAMVRRFRSQRNPKH